MWKIRNALCFQGLVFVDGKMVLIKAARTLRRWRALCKDSEGARLEEIGDAMDRKARELARLIWDRADVLRSTSEEMQEEELTNTLTHDAPHPNAHV